MNLKYIISDQKTVKDNLTTVSNFDLKLANEVIAKKEKKTTTSSLHSFSS